MRIKNKDGRQILYHIITRLGATGVQKGRGSKTERRLKIERSGIYRISLFLTSSQFLFWCKFFWIITLIILVIVYILGKLKHLILSIIVPHQVIQFIVCIVINQMTLKLNIDEQYWAMVWLLCNWKFCYSLNYISCLYYISLG